MLLVGTLPALVTQEKGMLMAITRKLAMLTLLLAALVALAGCSRKSDTTLIESGKQFMAQKDYARAALQFRNAIRANPKNAEAQYQLALAQMGFGDKISAYRALTKALDLNPNYKDAAARDGQSAAYQQQQPRGRQGSAGERAGRFGCGTRKIPTPSMPWHWPS